MQLNYFEIVLILVAIVRIQSFSAQQNRKNEISVGIDLGTTFSAIAYLDDESLPHIVPIPDNGRTMPSVVAFADSILVGQAACQYESMSKSSDAYRNVKRIIGTGGKLDKEVTAVVPFLHPNKGLGKTFVKNSLTNQLHDAMAHPSLLRDTRDPSRLLNPEVISSYILQHLQQAAALHTDSVVTKAVIGVPAHFTDTQKEATKRAAELCGIEKVKLIPEPEAAALAYGVGKRQLGDYDDDDELVLVFDLGGGTYDVSMLAVGGGVTEIIFTSGNAQLGGTTFDAKIAKYLENVLRKQGAPVQWSAHARNNIVLVAEAARIHLSNNRQVNLLLSLEEKAWTSLEQACDFILDENESHVTNSTHVFHSFSRLQMETICADEFQALIRPLREVAIMSGAMLAGDASPSSVSAASILEEEHQESLVFGNFYTNDDDETSTTERNTNDVMLIELEEASALKMAKKSQQRGRKKARNLAKNERKYRAEKRKLETPGKTESMKVRDGITGRPISRVVLVGGATRMPTIGSLLTQLTGVVPQRTVNPDEAVALGCAIHAGILDGDGSGEMVLNSMQAAILRAVAQRDGFGDMDDLDKELGSYDEEIIELG